MESGLPLVQLLQGLPGEEVGSPVSSLTEFYILVLLLVSPLVFRPGTES